MYLRSFSAARLKVFRKVGDYTVVVFPMRIEADRCNCVKSVHKFPPLLSERENSNKKQITKLEQFENVKNKTRETYLDMIYIYETNSVQRRGHVEFIYSALRHMEEFGVHKDLEVYKALINVLPKGKFIPTNIFQAEFMHYPKQQQCIIDVLEQMEINGVMPDAELQTILLNIFGSKGYPLRKYWRMMYWMPKFKNLSPWPLPDVMPNSSLELAKLALKRISSVDLQTELAVYQTKELEDSLEDTWIVSVQSPEQRKLLEKHPENIAVYVKGAYRVWLRGAAVNYFVLMRKPLVKTPKPVDDPDDVSALKNPFHGEFAMEDDEDSSVHVQNDGTIFAMCATGTSSKDSLLSWIRFLEVHGNSCLSKLPVIFTLKSIPLTAALLEEGTVSKEKTSVSGMEEK